jgi:iron complex outermembrane receptor protein
MIILSSSGFCRATRRVQGMSALAGATSLLALAVANPAFAQAAPDQASAGARSNASVTEPSANEQDIVVTGVRASVRSALDLKKNATQLQDSIVAEDIGKLPDNNVVEALQHVSGISIIRNNVEPGTVLIRGLPDIATTLSGRQIFSSTGRFISLPDLPAELLSRVDVKKSSSADDLEGGIAGLIDVRLHRPFDFKGLQIAGGIKGTYASLAQNFRPNASALISNRWNTGIGEIGVLVDVSYQNRGVRQDQISIGQRTNRTAGVANAGTGPAPGIPAGSVATPNTVTFFQRNGQIERASLNGSLQWRPAENIEIYSDYFYSRLRQKAPTDVNVLLNGTCPNGALTTPFPGTNVGQNLTSGCFGLTSIQDFRNNEDTQQVATGLNWEVSDRLTVKGEFNYTNSKVDTTNIIPDAQYNLPANGLTIGINALGDGGTIVKQVGDPQLGQTQYLDQLFDQRNVRRGHEYAGRLDASYKVSDDSVIRSVDLGYRFSSRASENYQPSNGGLNCSLTTGDGSIAFNKYRLAALSSPACVAYRNGATPQPFNSATQQTVGGLTYAALGANSTHRTKGSFFGGQYGTSAWINADPEFLYDNIEKLRGLYGYSGPQDFIPTNTFDVTETGNAGYVKVNYGLEIFGMPVDGNIGVRVIRTKLVEKAFTQQYVPLDPTLPSTQGANATCITCVVYTPVTATKTDTNVLPSFNIRLEPYQGLFVRGGVSKTVTRPTFLQLNPGLNLSSPTATLLGTAASGNPDLSPIKSTNYDLDVSYYWGKGNHLSAAVFYRQVSGYIQNAQTNITIAGTNYILTRPENFQDANITGVEVGYSQFLDFLPGALSGFGWDINATYIDAVFNNVAKYHANASAIYERGKYSLRFSYTVNSPYKIGAFAGGVQPQFNYAQVRENADFSFNYSWNDHLTLSIDATNLFNNYQKEQAGQGAINAMLYPTSISRFDQTYSFGLRYKL